MKIQRMSVLPEQMPGVRSPERGASVLRPEEGLCLGSLWELKG